MSPEQAMGEKLDGRSDIFSLGVCAFEMLSGEQPFPGNNVTSILYKLVHVDPVEPTSLEMNGLVPQKWHEVFNRVLAKKPDARYQTATEFCRTWSTAWLWSGPPWRRDDRLGGRPVVTWTRRSRWPSPRPPRPRAPCRSPEGANPRGSAKGAPARPAQRRAGRDRSPW